MPDCDMATAIVFGIGNLYRGDDGAGIRVARALKRRFPALRVHEIADAPAKTVALWTPDDAVYAVDTTVSGTTPGSVRRIDALKTRIPPDLFQVSSHGFGLAETIGLARALGELPRILTVIGIEGAKFGFGAGMGPAVMAGVEKAVELITEELQNHRPAHHYRS